MIICTVPPGLVLGGAREAVPTSVSRNATVCVGGPLSLIPDVRSHRLERALDVFPAQVAARSGKHDHDAPHHAIAVIERHKRKSSPGSARRGAATDFDEHSRKHTKQ